MCWGVAVAVREANILEGLLRLANIALRMDMDRDAWAWAWELALIVNLQQWQWSG